MHVLVLVGVPGSGKSTLSKRLSSLGWTHVNQDVLGSRRACEDALLAALQQGQNVVIDRCNISVEQRAHWLRLSQAVAAMAGGVHAVALQLLLPLELCKERARARPDHPTLGPHNCDEVIGRFAREFEPVSPSEGFARIVTVRSSEEAQAAVEQITQEAGPAPPPPSTAAAAAVGAGQCPSSAWPAAGTATGVNGAPWQEWHAGAPHGPDGRPAGPCEDAWRRQYPHDQHYHQAYDPSGYYSSSYGQHAQQHDQWSHGPWGGGYQRGQHGYQDPYYEYHRHHHDSVGYLQQYEGNYGSYGHGDRQRYGHHGYHQYHDYQRQHGYARPYDDPAAHAQDWHAGGPHAAHAQPPLPAQHLQLDAGQRAPRQHTEGLASGHHQGRHQPQQPIVMHTLHPDDRHEEPRWSPQFDHFEPAGAGEDVAYAHDQRDPSDGGAARSQYQDHRHHQHEGQQQNQQGLEGQGLGRPNSPAQKTGFRTELDAPQAGDLAAQGGAPCEPSQVVSDGSGAATGATQKGVEAGTGCSAGEQRRGSTRDGDHAIAREPGLSSAHGAGYRGPSRYHGGGGGRGWGRYGGGGGGSHRDIVARLRREYADPCSQTPYDMPHHPDAPADPRVILLFDLNGTLTSHTSVRKTQGITRVRPGTSALLRLKEHFRLGIYTSSTVRTAHDAMQQLEAAAGGPLFERRLVLHRDHTVPAPPGHVDGGGDPWDTLKPLQRYFSALHRVILMDDDAYKSIKGEESNMLVVPCWQDGDEGCPVLSVLSDELLALVAPLPQDADIREKTAQVSARLQAAAAAAAGAAAAAAGVTVGAQATVPSGTTAAAEVGAVARAGSAGAPASPSKRQRCCSLNGATGPHTDVAIAATGCSASEKADCGAPWTVPQDQGPSALCSALDPAEIDFD